MSFGHSCVFCSFFICGITIDRLLELSGGKGGVTTTTREGELTPQIIFYHFLPCPQKHISKEAEFFGWWKWVGKLPIFVPLPLPGTLGLSKMPISPVKTWWSRQRPEPHTSLCLSIRYTQVIRAIIPRLSIKPWPLHMETVMNESILFQEFCRTHESSLFVRFPRDDVVLFRICLAFNRFIFTHTAVANKSPSVRVNVCSTSCQTNTECCFSLDHWPSTWVGYRDCDECIVMIAHERHETSRTFSLDHTWVIF